MELPSSRWSTDPKPKAVLLQLVNIDCPNKKQIITEIALYDLERDFNSFVPAHHNRTTFNSILKVLWALDHFGPTLKRLIIRTPRVRLLKSEFYLILSMCPALESLCIIGHTLPTDQIERKDKIKLPKLKTLQLNRCSIDEKVIGYWLATWSKELTSVHFTHTNVHGSCLNRAPTSIRRLFVLDGTMLQMDYIYNYIKRNPKLKVVELCISGFIDIADITDNLPDLRTLRISGRVFPYSNNLYRLNQLKHLKLLVTGIFFNHFANSVMCEQPLEDLQLLINNVTITPEMAINFKHFVKMNYLHLILQPPVVNQNLLLPSLESLHELKHVRFDGIPFNFRSVCHHLKQIRTLNITAYADIQSPEALHHLHSLEVLYVAFLPNPDGNMPAAKCNEAMNKLVVHAAKSKSIHMLTIETYAPFEDTWETKVALETIKKSTNFPKVITVLQELCTEEKSTLYKSFILKISSRGTYSTTSEQHETPNCNSNLINIDC